MTNRSVLLALVLTFSATAAQAQDSTAVPTWTKSLTGQLSGAQAGFTNWAEGGVNTLALTFGVDGSAENTQGMWSQIYDIRLTFGLVKQGSDHLRKAEDLIRIRSSFLYTAEEGLLATLNPTFAAGFRSQFAPGKNFDKDPLGLDRELPLKVSDLFAPATLTQTLGLSWVASPQLTQRLGIAAKETIVTIEELRPIYNVDPDKSIRSEVGIEAFTELNTQLAENVHYKSTLGLFAAFDQADAPDMIWENAINMKVNGWLNVNFEWTLLYDTDVVSEIQTKEVFSVGVSYTFL
ncbi:MAG: hypothetical protein ACI80V_001677 [Rhodothermales bacterium]|jgi:hypothetical protein